MKTPCNAQAGSIWQRLGPGPANDVAIPAFLDPLAVAAHHWPAESIKPDATAIHVELHLTAYHPVKHNRPLVSRALSSVTQMPSRMGASNGLG